MTTMKGYGQFCPVSRASEILAERWTPLVVRELFFGSTRFSDIQRGLPRMSPSLLSRRLKELEHAGVVERRGGDDGRSAEYLLTASGNELFPIIREMGVWAQRWVRDDLTRSENLDPELLMWDIRRRVAAEAVPGHGRYVVQFNIAGVRPDRQRYWLIFDKGEADICFKYPGYAINLTAAAHIRDLTAIWIGHLGIDEAKRTDKLRLDGDAKDIKAFAAWFALSSLAGVEAAE